MFKQNKRTCITQSGKSCAINCAIQGVRLIWKQKIWLAICEFLWSLTNQNAWFVSSFCSELTFFCTVFEKNCTALNQSKWRNFFMYIIRYQITGICVNFVALVRIHANADSSQCVTGWLIFVRSILVYLHIKWWVKKGCRAFPRYWGLPGSS